jgi:D-alanyl-D-alanine carboxypeptidase (penicillin-binding protein 5/6)
MFIIQFLLVIAGLCFSIGSHAQELPPATPEIFAKGYFLQDYQSGQVLLEKDADIPVEPASLTKLMTAYLVFKQLKENKLALIDTATVSSKARQTLGSRTYLEVNHEVSIEQLIQGMIVQSGNDAAVTLAEKVAGTEEKFVAMMNEQSKMLGLNNTHFSNCTGLPDPTHRSSARDLAKIATAIIHDFPEYYHWYSQREFTYNNITQVNRNLLLEKDKTVDGIKTGHTDAAGFCLVASAKRNDNRLISVVLGTKSPKERADESLKLLEYGFAAFETFLLYQTGQTISKRRVWYGEYDELTLGLQKPLYLTIPKGKRAEINITLFADKHFKAPIAAGRVCGNVKISLHGKVLEERPVVALNSIIEGSITKRMMDYFVAWFH